MPIARPWELRLRDHINWPRLELLRDLGGVISQSFSATEQSFVAPGRLLSLRSAYTAAFRYRVTVLAASGDSGAADAKCDGSTYFLKPVTSWPDSDPLVTGVGGTQLHLAASGRPVRPATVWNDTDDAATNEFIFGDRGPNPLASGFGKSVVFARPGYQARVRGIVGPHRGQGSGNKLVTVRGFAARRGYDLASGLGTVNGPAFVSELAFLANHRQWTDGELRLALAKLP